MIETIPAFAIMLCGAALIWAAVNITMHLTRLVRLPRAAAFECVHIGTVWTVGTTSVLAGLLLIAEGLTVIGTVPE